MLELETAMIKSLYRRGLINDKDFVKSLEYIENYIQEYNQNNEYPIE